MKENICVLNNIAESGLRIIRDAGFTLRDTLDDCCAILVRSHRLSADDIPQSCLAVARAGVGVNNIPVEDMGARGTVVFNTPGANANSVKELVIAGLLLASRPISEALEWMRGIDTTHSELERVVEQGKRQFAGCEILGKRLGVIGLGAIGVEVSNAAEALGMHVLGYDPFITVRSAWGLSRNVEKIERLDRLCAQSDFITLHVPLTKQTAGMINQDILRNIREGAVLLNFSRAELIDHGALRTALNRERMRLYVSDFPHRDLMGNKRALMLPHLGASTMEAEENCARMACEQLVSYIRYGNIVNSVNFPTCVVDKSNHYRITIANRNVPTIVGQITAYLADEKVNIQDFTNRHYDGIAYNIIDTDVPPSDDALHRISAIDGVLSIRRIAFPQR